MIGLIMAGGKGSRMESKDEKLLLRYKKPIILHVVDALKNAECFEKILAVVSENSPKTKQLLDESNIETIQTTGQGYSEDLNQVLRSIEDYVLVTSGDLPFLDGEITKKIVEQYDPNNVWTSFVISEGFLESLELTAEFEIDVGTTRCYYTGISLINAKKISDFTTISENYVIFDDARLAFNLNTKSDFEKLQSNF